MKNIIYALIDPDTKEIRYIGMSSCGLSRPMEHRKLKNLKDTSHKKNWIKKLLKDNKMYEIIILETLESSDTLSSREIFWIAHYKAQGANLTNLTDGGEGSPGYKFSQESKDKISASRKEFFSNNPEAALDVGERSKKKPTLINGIEYQNCSDCKKDLPLLISFYPNKGRWNGRDSLCKTCGAARLKTRAVANKLSPEAFQKSYADRKDAMRVGAKAAYTNDPTIREKLSKALSKAVEAHNPITGEVLKFDSALKAKEAGYQNSNVGQAIKLNKLYKGYYWKFA